MKNMLDHLTTEHLVRFRAGDLASSEVMAIVRHLDSCANCAMLARDFAERSAGTESLRLAFAGEAKHPLAESLIAFADGSLKSDERVAIAQHLDVCAQCRAETDDIIRLRPASAPRSSFRWRYPLVTAAALIAAIAIAGLFRSRVPAVSPAPSQPRVAESHSNEWDAVIAQARAAGIARPSFLSEIRALPDTARGGESQAARHDSMQPVGVVVESALPSFVWNAPGRSYIVAILDGPERIAASPPITAMHWTPSKPLDRGRIYEWQVEVRDTKTRVIPAAPLPPAFFRVMDDESFRAIDSARRERANDHLLLGVLYARAGAQREAIEELTQHLRTHPADIQARALSESIARW